MYQRQLSKEGLQNVVNADGGGAGSNAVSSEELRDLFTLRPNTPSDTYDSMCSMPSANQEAEDLDQVQQDQVPFAYISSWQP